MKKIASLFVLSALTIACIIIQPASALENSWISRPPMLESAGRAVTVEGKIYAIGEAVQVYDPTTLSWTKKASIPINVGGGIATYENKIYLIGDSYNQVYDVASNTWANKTAMPTWRIGVQANVVGDKIYLIGGTSDTGSGTITGVNEAYNPTTDTWTTEEPIPTPVTAYASTVVDNKIYIIGGSAKPPNIVLDSVQIYNPENDSWTIGTSMPIAVRIASAAATTGLFAPKRIYVIGGIQSGSGLDLNQVYDPQTDRWITGALMPTARYNLGVAVVNDTLYALGGVLLPPYAFPKEPLTTNEAYLPIGYQGPNPPYWQPSPTLSPSPLALSPSPNPTPTPSAPTPTPTVSEFPSWTLLLLLSIMAATAGLLVYHKKRKHFGLVKKP